MPGSEGSSGALEARSIRHNGDFAGTHSGLRPSGNRCFLVIIWTACPASNESLSEGVRKCRNEGPPGEKVGHITLSENRESQILQTKTWVERASKPPGCIQHPKLNLQTGESSSK